MSPPQEQFPKQDLANIIIQEAWLRAKEKFRRVVGSQKYPPTTQQLFIKELVDINLTIAKKLGETIKQQLCKRFSEIQPTTSATIHISNSQDLLVQAVLVERSIDNDNLLIVILEQGIYEISTDKFSTYYPPTFTREQFKNKKEIDSEYYLTYGEMASIRLEEENNLQKMQDQITSR